MINLTVLKDKKILVIVESYKKMQTIASIFHNLNLNNVTVTTTNGLIATISNSKKSFKYTGIYPKENFRADWELISNKHGIILSVMNQVQQADKIYIFSDPDANGIQYAWSLVTFLNLGSYNYSWVPLDTLTEESIKQALLNENLLDMPLVDAAQTHLIINKLFSYAVNPFIKTYLGINTLSLVHAFLLSLIIKREQEITDFVSKDPYYKLIATFNTNNKSYEAKYIEQLANENTAIRLKNNCINILKLTKITKKTQPFILNTLTILQKAEEELQLSASTTLIYLQQLFEGILIDGQLYSLISFYKTTEPIYCTNLQFTPDFLKSKLKSKVLLKLYNLIWNYSQVQQTINFIYELETSNLKFVLVTTDNLELTTVSDVNFEIQKYLNKAPDRYTEVQLLTELAKLNLDYLNINLDTFLTKKQAYCTVVNDQIIPTRDGIYLGKYLERNFAAITSKEYQQKLFNQINSIRQNKCSKEQVLSDFYTILELSLSLVREVRPKLDIIIKCPICDNPMILKKNRWGKYFYGCSQWPDCKGIREKL